MARSRADDISSLRHQEQPPPRNGRRPDRLRRYQRPERYRVDRPDIIRDTAADRTDRRNAGSPGAEFHHRTYRRPARRRHGKLHRTPTDGGIEPAHASFGDRIPI